MRTDNGVPGSNRAPPNGVSLYQPVLAATSRCMILIQGILPDLENTYEKSPKIELLWSTKFPKNPSPNLMFF